MIRSTLMTSALLASTIALASGPASASMTSATDTGTAAASGTAMLLVQGAGGGGSGDSAGRGPDTSKGAVGEETKPYPASPDSMGSAPVPPSPTDPAGSPGVLTPPHGTPIPEKIAPGTDMTSPGTTQEGGKTRTDH